MKKNSFIIFSLFLLSSYLLIGQTKSNYEIINKFSLPGNGSWDYLTKEEESDRLFISHGTMVQVLDVKTGKIIGTIDNTKGVHGIALAKDLNKGFISNGADTSVTVFDLKTLTTITKIKVTGNNPDAILYDESTHRVFTFNGRGKNSTVIDAKTNTIIGTIMLDGKPEFSVTDGKGKIYVNIEDKNSLTVINAKTLKIETTWSISPGEEPSGLALDNFNHRLFSVCDNKIMIVSDSKNGKIIAQVPIGSNVDGVVFDPETKRIYCSNGEGTLTIVEEENANQFKVVENFVTQKGARTVAIDSKTHHIYLSTAEFGERPEPTAENPKPRAKIKDGTFIVIEVAIKNE
jgi:DNA-binding beta-propeller fold protein YncE